MFIERVSFWTCTRWSQFTTRTMCFLRTVFSWAYGVQSRRPLPWLLGFVLLVCRTLLYFISFKHVRVYICFVYESWFQCIYFLKMRLLEPNPIVLQGLPSQKRWGYAEERTDLILGLKVSSYFLKRLFCGVLDHRWPILVLIW